MQVTLRNARRLERAIEQTVNNNLNAFNPHGIQVSIYQNFLDVVLDARKKVMENISTTERLIRIRTDIRKSIQTDNENSGLNFLTSEEATLRSLSNMYARATTAELTATDMHIAQRRHEAAIAKGSASDDYGRVADSISVPAFLNTETLSFIASEQKTITRRLLQIADECSSRNTTRTITVSDSDIEFLESNNIVL